MMQEEGMGQIEWLKSRARDVAEAFESAEIAATSIVNGTVSLGKKHIVAPIVEFYKQDELNDLDKAAGKATDNANEIGHLALSFQSERIDLIKDKAISEAQFGPPSWFPIPNVYGLMASVPIRKSEKALDLTAKKLAFANFLFLQLQLPLAAVVRQFKVEYLDHSASILDTARRAMLGVGKNVILQAVDNPPPPYDRFYFWQKEIRNEWITMCEVAGIPVTSEGIVSAENFSDGRAYELLQELSQFFGQDESYGRDDFRLKEVGAGAGPLIIVGVIVAILGVLAAIVASIHFLTKLVEAWKKDRVLALEITKETEKQNTELQKQATIEIEMVKSDPTMTSEQKEVAIDSIQGKTTKEVRDNTNRAAAAIKHAVDKTEQGGFLKDLQELLLPAAILIVGGIVLPKIL